MYTAIPVKSEAQEPQRGQNLLDIEMFAKYGPLWLSTLRSSRLLPDEQFSFS